MHRFILRREDSNKVGSESSDVTSVDRSMDLLLNRKNGERSKILESIILINCAFLFLMFNYLN